MEYRKFELFIAERVNSFFEAYALNNPKYIEILPDYTKKEIHLNANQFFAPFLDLKKESKIDNYIPIAIALELCMTSAYKTNIILDEKYDAWSSHEKIKKIHIQSHLIKSCIYDLIDIAKIPNDHRVFINLIINKINNHLVSGFIIERKLKFNNQTNLENYWEVYKYRNISLNKVYDWSPLLGYFCLTGKSLFEEYDVLDKPFSYSGQIINDLSDFSSIYDENVKKYQDNFSDLKNKIVTYPTLKVLERDLKIAEELFNIDISEKSNRIKIFNIIKEIGVYDDVVNETYQSFEQIKNFITSKMQVTENSYTMRTYKLLLDNKYFKKFSETTI